MTGDRRHDRQVLIDLSRLVATDRAPLLFELWQAGEEGLALELLADALAERYAGLTGDERAQLAAAASRWDVYDSVSAQLRWCPDLDAEDQPWTVVEGGPGEAGLRGLLAREIAPGHVLHGIPLTPWLTCNACDDVLVRLDDEAARAGRVPYLCAVVHPVWGGRQEQPPLPFTAVYESAYDALDDLMGCFNSSAQA